MLLMPQIQLVLQQNFSIELLGIQWYSLPEGPFHGLLRDFFAKQFYSCSFVGNFTAFTRKLFMTIVYELAET